LVAVVVVFDRFPHVLAKDEEETKNEGSLIHVYHPSHGYHARGAHGARVASGPAAWLGGPTGRRGRAPLGLVRTQDFGRRI
jgi:hypothetical protein